MHVLTFLTVSVFLDTMLDKTEPPPDAPAPGTRVEIYWTDDQIWYPCTIKQGEWDVDGTWVCMCEYDVGEPLWHNLKEVRHRPLTPRNKVKRSRRQKSPNRSQHKKSHRKKSKTHHGHSSASHSGVKRSHHKKTHGKKVKSQRNCDHRQVFLKASPYSLIQEGGTFSHCPTCKQRVWVCPRCYRGYSRRNNVLHLEICVGNNVEFVPVRYRDTKSGKFREGRCNSTRNHLRGAPADPTGLVKVESTLTPTFLPLVYRNAIIAGSTPCVDRSRMGPVELLLSLHTLLDNTGALFERSKMKEDKFGMLHVVEGGQMKVTSSEVFGVLQGADPCYITISLDKINDAQFKARACPDICVCVRAICCVCWQLRHVHVPVP